jgi:hypothetical protein
MTAVVKFIRREQILTREQENIGNNVEQKYSFLPQCALYGESALFGVFLRKRVIWLISGCHSKLVS